MTDLIRKIGNTLVAVSPEKDYRFAGLVGHFKNYKPDAGADVTTAETWTHTQTGSNTWVASDTTGEDFTITTAGTEYNGYSSQLLGECFAVASGKPFYVGAQLKLSDATQTDVLFGLAETDTTLTAASAAHAINVGGDGLFFAKLDGVTTITANIYDGGSAVATATVADAMDTAYHYYEIYSDDGVVVNFMFDGALVASVYESLPTASMRLSLSFRAGDGNARTLSVKDLLVSQVYS